MSAILNPSRTKASYETARFALERFDQLESPRGRSDIKLNALPIKILAASIDLIEEAGREKRLTPRALLFYFAKKGIALADLSEDERVECFVALAEFGTSSVALAALGAGTVATGGAAGWLAAIAAADLAAAGLDVAWNCSKAASKYMESPVSRRDLLWQYNFIANMMTTHEAMCHRVRPRRLRPMAPPAESKKKESTAPVSLRLT
jgi:hypothetical protein